MYRIDVYRLIDLCCAMDKWENWEFWFRGELKDLNADRYILKKPDTGEIMAFDSNDFKYRFFAYDEPFNNP